MSKLTISYQRDFSGHKQSVYCVVADGLGGFFTAGSDGFIVHWVSLEMEDGFVFARVPEAVFSLYYDSTTEMIIAGGQYGNIYILKKNQSPKILKIHEGSVFWVGKRGEFWYSASAQGDVIRFDSQGNINKSIKLSKLSLRYGIWVENRLWISGSEGRLWELTSDLEIHASHLLGDKSWFRMQVNEQWVFAVGRDAKLHRWNRLFLDTSIQDAHWYSIHGLALSPNERIIATGSMDKSLRLWDVQSLQLRASITSEHPHGHRSSVNDIIWLDDRTLVSVSDDATVRCWKIKD